MHVGIRTHEGETSTLRRHLRRFHKDYLTINVHGRKINRINAMDKMMSNTMRHYSGLMYKCTYFSCAISAITSVIIVRLRGLKKTNGEWCWRKRGRGKDIGLNFEYCKDKHLLEQRDIGHRFASTTSKKCLVWKLKLIYKE